MKTFKVFEMKLRWCSAESGNMTTVIQISEFYDQTKLMYISWPLGSDRTMTSSITQFRQQW